MDAVSSLSTVLSVPILEKTSPRPLDVVLAGSGEAFGAIYEHKRDRRDPDQIAQAIAQAEAFMSAAADMVATLHEAAKPAEDEVIEQQLDAFVRAWPNASSADLAGYGAFLVQDVMDRQPCRYALRAGLRHLRQTSRFLPSIAEVLTALDAAQARIRNTAWHVNQIPAELETARADLVVAEARAAAQRQRAIHLEHPAP